MTRTLLRDKSLELLTLTAPDFSEEDRVRMLTLLTFPLVMILILPPLPELPFSATEKELIVEGDSSDTSTILNEKLMNVSSTNKTFPSGALMIIFPAFPELFTPKESEEDSEKEKEERAPVEISPPAVKVISPPSPEKDSEEDSDLEKDKRSCVERSPPA